MWTVDAEFEQPIRHMNQAMSSGSFYVNFTLRLTPSLEERDVRFINQVKDVDAEPFVPFIEAGIQEFLEQRRQQHKAVGYLTVVLIEARIHSVDSKSGRFQQAAVMAMEQAFESHGIWLG